MCVYNNDLITMKIFKNNKTTTTIHICQIIRINLHYLNEHTTQKQQNMNELQIVKQNSDKLNVTLISNIHARAYIYTRIKNNTLLKLEYYIY